MRKLFLILFVFCQFACSPEDPTKDVGVLKACIKMPQNATALTALHFDGACSQKAESYEWKFGDGATSTESSPTHMYVAKGTYTVELTVKGANNTSDTFTSSLQVGEISSSKITSHMGSIDRDEVWEPGVHKILYDLKVNDATLTLKPGVVVLFDKETSLGIGTKDGVTRARLIAEGTASQPILFTANSATPVKGYYSGIFFGNGDSGTSSMKYCTIEYGGSIYGSKGALVSIGNTAVTLENNIFRNSAGTGVAIQTGGSFTSLTNNVFTAIDTHPLDVIANAVTSIGDNNSYDSDKTIRVWGTLDVPAATWKKLAVPYYLNNELSIGSASGTTLTLSPGVTFKADGGSIAVGPYAAKGKLVAEGTAQAPILFTSANANPMAEDWGGIYFMSGNDPASSLKYCQLEYGGENFGNRLALIRVEWTSVNINHCSFKSSSPYAVWLNEEGYFNSFENNTINNPNANGIYIYSNNASTIGTTNTVTAIKELTVVGRITKNVTWPKQSFPYYVIDWIGVGSTEGNILTIAAGVKVKFKHAYSFSLGRYDKGGLVANGTVGDPIVFSSDAATQAPKSWEGFYFGPNTMAGTVLNNCIIEYAGSNTGIGAISVENTSIPSITNCTIRYSGSFGISLKNASPTLTNNVYTNNAGVDVKTL